MRDARPSHGHARQSAVYRAGVSGQRPSVPTDFAMLERAAKRRCSRQAWAYVAGGAGSERTMAANRAAFDRYELVPRMLQGSDQRDLSTTLLGTRMPAPILMAPIGAAGLVRRGADILSGQAAADVGVPMILSSQGSSSMEHTAAAMGAGPRWFQLYWSREESVVDSFLGRAESMGAEAVVVTLDTTMLGWRPRDLNLGNLPFAQGIGIAQYTSDPAFRELVQRRVEEGGGSGGARVSIQAIRTLLSICREHPGSMLRNLRSPEPRAAVETFLESYSNPTLSWDHLASLRARTALPIVLKGILHPDDARKAAQLGVDAIMVSNHGGRQVDGAIASLDALVTIREVVGEELPLILDSGIRGGTDVFTALALGADAVTVGRPFVYGLALTGRAGVADVLRNVIAELDLTMALCGITNIDELDASLLGHSPPARVETAQWKN